MSIQDEPIRCDTPEQKSSSSVVITPGSRDYDPFEVYDDDEREKEQLKTDTNHQKQESIRMNNGSATYPVINNSNTSSSNDKPPSLQINEQQTCRKSKSPIEHHSKQSKSPYHRSSERKRLRPSSPDTHKTSNMNIDQSSNSDIISSTKHKKSNRHDTRKRSRHHHRHRSSSNSSASSSSSSSITSSNKKSCDSKNDKTDHRISKRDDYHSHRHNTSRNYHSYSSQNCSSSSSTHQTSNDRRSINSKYSNSPSIPSTIISNNGNSSIQTNNHEKSPEDQNKNYNHLKNINETNSSTIQINNSNKVSSSGSSFINSNGNSQRSRSNLIQIITTEATPISTHMPAVRLSTSSQVKSEPKKPTITTNSSKTIDTLKTNGNKADDLLMEDMLLDEEREQNPAKPIDIDSVNIPETSTEKSNDNTQESIKTTTTTTTTSTTATVTSVPSLTPSPTKKPYTLYKVPHTNHMTPPLSSRHKKPNKQETSTTQSDSTIRNKPSIDDNSRRQSLDERISNMLRISLNKSNDQHIDDRSNPLAQTTSTPSDKSTESPQDVTLLVSKTIKKEHELSSKNLHTNDETRPKTSTNYTVEWVASQKPEEPPTEELGVLPSLVPLPTLVSSQPSTKPPITNSADEALMIGKLSEAMNKLIQKQSDTNVPATIETDDAVPISAKHLERIERRKQREKRQSEIATIAKEALKPAFRKHSITKEEYKEIMKKVVTKATNANEVDRVRIGKMINAYVDKYRKLRQQNNLKSSTNSNGTVS